jgi:hypothetical protein
LLLEVGDQLLREVLDGLPSGPGVVVALPRGEEEEPSPCPAPLEDVLHVEGILVHPIGGFKISGGPAARRGEISLQRKGLLLTFFAWALVGG